MQDGHARFVGSNMTPEHDPNAVAVDHLEALLKVSYAVAGHQELGPLLDTLSVLLHDVIEFDRFVLLLYDADDDEGLVYYPGSHKEVPFTQIGNFTFRDGPGFWTWMHQAPVVLSLGELARSFPKIFPLRHREKMASSCTVPLTASQRRLGALEFISTKPEAYGAEDVRFIQLVAAQVAIFVDNALVYARAKSFEDGLVRERQQFRTLMQIMNAAVTQLDTQVLMSDLSPHIAQLTGAEFCGLVLRDSTEDQLRWEVVHIPGERPFNEAARAASMKGSIIDRAVHSRTPCVLCREEMQTLGRDNYLVSLLLQVGVRSFCVLPLTVRGAVVGALMIGHLACDRFDAAARDLLEDIAWQIALAVDNIYAYRKIRSLKDKRSSEALYLEDELKERGDYTEIVGESAAMRAVMRQAQLVAGSDSPVLILGETGTGKELIARAIHDMSERQGKTLVKVNCAAIPAGLLESELFGHEKGAFTGAISRKIGRFELAHKGTIFLDEIGDMPLELQGKLLRALQEQEIERLGSIRPIKVDARVVAATNRELEQMIADGTFRSDLYYRLNVFPIVIPPLRERREDIAPLVHHFVRMFARRLKRDIQTISDDTMATLVGMAWPGNIREVRNLIERAVIVSSGSILEVPLQSRPTIAPPRGRAPAADSASPEGMSLENMEREHILRVLREANGVVAGPRGAAARLGVKRTTLLSKMQRLGIAATSGRNKPGCQPD
jgi:formate hydrogenlyase transcriptional activator